MIPRPCALAVLVAGKKASGILEGNPAEPRIENRECSLDETKGKNKTDLPTSSKWQIGLFLWLKVARAMRKRARKGRKLHTEGVQNRRFWRAFGDFPRDGKVTRVPSMALPCSRGAPAGGCRDYQSRKSPGAWGGAPIHGGVGAKSDDLLPRGEVPKNWDTSRSRQSPCNSPGRSRPRC